MCTNIPPHTKPDQAVMLLISMFSRLTLWCWVTNSLPWRRVLNWVQDPLTMKETMPCTENPAIYPELVKPLILEQNYNVHLTKQE